MYTVVSVLCSVCSKVMQSVEYPLNASRISYGFTFRIKRSYTINVLQYRRQKCGDLYCRSRYSSLPQPTQFVKLRFLHYQPVGLPHTFCHNVASTTKLLVLIFLRKTVTCLNAGLLRNFPVLISFKIVYRWVTTNCCFLRVILNGDVFF